MQKQTTNPPTRILILEDDTHVGFGALTGALNSDSSLTLESRRELPTNLSAFQAILINNIDVSQPSPRFSPDSLSEYVETGGGVVAIHDSVFLRPGFERFLDLLGLRFAFGAMQLREVEPNRYMIESWRLALGHPTEPMRQFPVEVIPGDPPHPVVEGIEDFEIGDEFWGVNVAPDVNVLMRAMVGDRLPVVPRLQDPSPLVGTRQVGSGRTVFCLLGHYPATYSNPHFRRLIYNSVLWAAKRTHQRSHKYDLFVSYAEEDLDVAQAVAREARQHRLELFLANMELKFGDIWDEEIRSALLSSREICLVVSEDSLHSEWVTTEWGAAWVLGKRVTPILKDIGVEALPERLRRYQAAMIDQIGSYLQQVARRAPPY